MIRNFGKHALSLALILGAAAPMASSSAKASERLSWKQRKELFLEGTVTDDKGQVWDIILVPGVDNVTDDAGHGWRQFGEDLSQLGTEQFWKMDLDEMKDGLDFSKDVVLNQWLEGIKDDFKEAVQQNNDITPGEIGSGLEHVASWSWFGIKAIARTVWMPVGTAGGLGYSLVAPPVTTLGLPVGSFLFNGAARGAVVPGVLYVWNGVAWVGTSFGNVPTQESFFVTLQYSPDPQTPPTNLVIDAKGFESVVQASVLEEMTDEQKAALQAKIDQLQAQIQVLQAQQQALGDKQNQAQNNLANSPSQKALNDLYNQAMSSSQVTMSQDAKNAYLDQDKLREVVKAYLVSLGVTNPSPEMIDSIVKRIGQTLTDMRVDMNQAPSHLN